MGYLKNQEVVEYERKFKRHAAESFTPMKNSAQFGKVIIITDQINKYES